MKPNTIPVSLEQMNVMMYFHARMCQYFPYDGRMLADFTRIMDVMLQVDENKVVGLTAQLEFIVEDK